MNLLARLIKAVSTVQRRRRLAGQLDEYDEALRLNPERPTTIAAMPTASWAITSGHSKTLTKPSGLTPSLLWPTSTGETRT